MKNITAAALTLFSISAFAGIVDKTVTMVEEQYGLKCVEAKELNQEFFKPIRHKEEIKCKDASQVTQVVIQTEARAKSEPIYKVQVLSANPDYNL